MCDFIKNFLLKIGIRMPTRGKVSPTQKIKIKGVGGNVEAKNVNVNKK